MKKLALGLGIALLAAGILATGVLAANWFWGGMPMMRTWRGTNLFGGWFNQNNERGPNYGCDSGSGAYSSPMWGGGRNGGRGYGGMMGGYGGGGYGGMMGGYRGSYSNGSGDSCQFYAPGDGSTSGTRITISQAQTSLEEYLGNEPGLELGEIMEFEYNFYGVVLEENTGRGAMELLVDPYSGAVHPEYGPNMMWNEKYGHMGSWYSTSSNPLTFDEAKTLAQAELDRQIPGAVIEGMGIEFYGYFTFDYTLDDEIAGMLSVNNNGQTWLHDWHGPFIAEVELHE